MRCTATAADMRAAILSKIPPSVARDRTPRITPWSAEIDLNLKEEVDRSGSAVTQAMMALEEGRNRKLEQLIDHMNIDEIERPCITMEFGGPPPRKIESPTLLTPTTNEC